MNIERAIQRMALVLVLGTSVTLPACHHASSDEALGKSARGEARVTGTVVDAQSGEPILGVEVKGPRGSRAVTGRDGRFELAGLAPGDEGEITAQAEGGRKAMVTLRKLEAGRLEIVLQLSAR